MAQTASASTADALADIVLPDQDGNEVRLGDLWRDGPVALVWLRHYGWIYCKAHAIQLDRARDRFEAAGGKLVLIGQLTPRHAAHFRRREKVDVTVLADNDRESYRAAGARVGGVGQLVGPSVVAKGLMTTLRTGKMQTRTIGNPAQLGGSMVIRQDGTVAFSQMAKDASDNVSPEELVAAVRGARAWDHPRIADDAQILAPFTATVVEVVSPPGHPVTPGQPVLVLEAMKMEHEIVAQDGGLMKSIEVQPGQTVQEGDLLAVLEPADHGSPGPSQAPAAESETRDDLQAVLARHALTQDAARPEAVAKRHDQGRRTARENVADLIDPGSLVEYGPLMFAAQERRREKEELIRRTPADGLVAGSARIDGHESIVLSYDYTVLAGTQGMRNHTKKDRLFELAQRRRLPVVLFAEGGGGRPGDVDWPHVAGLDCRAFHLFAQLSGLVPLVGIASGYCFAGNAALLGCCDVVIASEDASIGMGGPAMIEGGGLGSFAPGEVGPIDVQYSNGVVDLRVKDDAEAVRAARRYLSYFHGPGDPGDPRDPEALRDLIPVNRRRIYDTREVISALLDDVLELRAGWGPGVVTALARHEGRPLGVIANDPSHLGGAIDAEGADKTARFMQLCDAFALPILLLCDTPGFMVGPESERTATVRHFARMFVTGANLDVPIGTIVLRKGYGLGAQAMAGGGFKAGLFCVGWPTSEFGAMGLEGAVRLGMRRELEAIEDPEERERAFQATVAAAYERGQGINMAAYFEIDDVIDPADSHRWIDTLFRDDSGAWWQRPGKRRPNVDAW